LKTLEEPPTHVVFIFATTAPQKVPATILSRCQRFDFKRIPTKTIVEVLSDLCKKEKIKVDQDALFAISKSAQGSFRDALGTLDQISSISDRGIGADDVFSMLGLVETELLFELVNAISEKDSIKAIKIFGEIIDKGKDVRQLAKDITEHFRNLMIVRVGGKSLGKLIDYPNAIKDMLLAQSKKFALKDILYALDMLIAAQDIARVTETMQMPLEIAIAKLTYSGENSMQVENAAPKKENVEPPTRAKILSPATALKSKKGQVDISGKIDSGDDDVSESEKDLDVSDLTIERVRSMWDALTHAVSREKMSVATFLQDGAPSKLESNKITVAFTPEKKFQKESLETGENTKLVQRILSEKLNNVMVIKYIIEEDVEHVEEDSKVQNILETFGGEIVHKWHNE